MWLSSLIKLALLALLVSVPIDVPETEYTVEFWFRTEDPNAGLYSIVDQNLGVGGHDRHIHLIDGNVRIRNMVSCRTLLSLSCCSC